MKSDAEFFVAGNPVPQGAISRNKFGQGFHQNDKALRAWREAVGWTAKQYYPTPIPKEIAIGVTYTFILLKPKTVTRASPVVRPDLDHLIRAVNDALTGVAFFDDSQVTGIIATKEYGTLAGVHVTLIPYVVRADLSYFQSKYPVGTESAGDS